MCLRSVPSDGHKETKESQAQAYEQLNTTRLVPDKVQLWLHPTASPFGAVLPPLFRHHSAKTCQKVQTFPRGSYGKLYLWSKALDVHG